MRTSALKAVLPCATLFLATSCIDNNYDLSDIDTTSEVKVLDLTLPINLDAITLSDIISIDDGDQIHEVTDLNGNKFYAFTESGSFKSDPIYINEVTIKGPKLEESNTHIQLVIPDAYLKGVETELPDLYYDISQVTRTFSYETHSVDESICDIKSAKTAPLKFTITLNCPDIVSHASKVSIQDLKIKLVKGLTASTDAGTYDTKTGVWSVGNVVVNGSTASITLTSTGFDFQNSDMTFNGASHTLTVPGEFTVLSGQFVITPIISNVPESFDLNIKYSLDDVEITSFTGRVKYTLDGMNVNPISLNDIPDFLSNDGTNVFLANPQIYLTINNPVADEKLSCQAGLTLTAKRANSKSYSYSAQSPITIGYNKGVVGPYNFVLAPNTSSAELNILDSKYRNDLTGISFPGLGDILAVPTSSDVAGLPQTIEVELTDPQILEGDVTDFALGRDITGVDGAYEFVAPLALGDGTTIIYSGIEDGWNDEDVDKIEISKLTVTALVTNNTPLAADVKAYPLDVNGNRITGVEISGATVNAGAVDEPITITMTGEVQHLDGINYIAVLNPGSEDALTPNQNISLTNIKVTVSGSYTTDF